MKSATLTYIGSWRDFKADSIQYDGVGIDLYSVRPEVAGGFETYDARWEDDRRTSTQPNLPLDIQDSNTKVNLRLGIGSASRRWMLEVWGNNITDKRTKNVTFNTPLRIGSRGSFAEAPRTYGVTLRTEW